MCNHHFVDGFGGMGDALVCCKCGLDKYPETIPIALMIAELQGLVVRSGDPNYEAYVKKAQEARHARP